MSKYLDFIGQSISTVKFDKDSDNTGLSKSAKVGIGLTAIGAVGLLYSKFKAKKEIEEIQTLPNEKSIDQIFEQTGRQLGFDDMPISFESDQYDVTQVADQKTVPSYEFTEQLIQDDIQDDEDSFDFDMFSYDTNLEDTLDIREDLMEDTTPLDRKFKGAANIEDEESSDDIFGEVASEFKFTHDELGESQSEESFTEMFGLEPVSITSLPEDNSSSIEDDVFGGSTEGFGGTLKSGVAPQIAPGFQG